MKKWQAWLGVLLLVALAGRAGAQAEVPDVVLVDGGSVQGVRAAGVISRKGIPYADRAEALPRDHRADRRARAGRSPEAAAFRARAVLRRRSRDALHPGTEVLRDGALKGRLAEQVERLRTRYDVELPLSDLFVWGTPDAPLDALESAMFAGQDMAGQLHQ